MQDLGMEKLQHFINVIALKLPYKLQVKLKSQ